MDSRVDVVDTGDGDEVEMVSTSWMTSPFSTVSIPIVLMMVEGWLVEMVCLKFSNVQSCSPTGCYH